jgi:hypothetical protein
MRQGQAKFPEVLISATEHSELPGGELIALSEITNHQIAKLLS